MKERKKYPSALKGAEPGRGIFKATPHKSCLRCARSDADATRALLGIGSNAD